MREVCFCGWSGEVADREPIYAGDGEWGLACPVCGHLDRLEWLPTGGRRFILAEADRRLSERSAAGQPPGRMSGAPMREAG